MAVEPVDMRRSFDGLCATICEALGSNSLSGDLFLFRGKYRLPSPEAVSIELSEHELTLLLGGVGFARLRRLPPLSVHTLLP